jgi:transcriptional regulator with PAS, ATPase and Fis domain
MSDFGVDRSIEPLMAIPVAAWKLDNDIATRKGELRVRVKIIKLEQASFRQLCSECGYDELKIKAKIFDIIKRRGKLHNPTTGSGGIFYGIADEAGEGYKNRDLYKPGDKVICITSLTAVPIRLNRIDAIDFNYGQISVEGYAILANTYPLIHLPEGLPVCYTMAAFEEACSLHRVFQLASGTTDGRFLLISSDLLSATLYAAVFRKAAGESCRIVAVLDRKSMERIPDSDIKHILSGFVDEIYIVDILAPLKSFKAINEKEKKLFDICVNCADLMGAEAVSVLLTEKNGTVVFTSFINNHGLALLFAESLGKEINTHALDSYTDDYEKFTVNLIKDTKNELDRLHKLYVKYKDIRKHLSDGETDSDFPEESRLSGFVFASENMRNVKDEALNIAKYDCNVVILGETGVGKEKVLSIIHNNSNRKLNACIRINCAAIPETLAESEFFGYEAGAFTGAASNGKAGYFELANNGILFLDEVGLLPAAIQVKLLRVLQENQFFRIGGMKQIDVNVRIVSASNISLKELVREGKFREDLYYRLNICEINIPPLRERAADITCLAKYFLASYNENYNIDKQFEARALDAMLAYEWPGNVRELENTVHRIVVSSRGDKIREEDVYRALSQSPHGVSLTPGKIEDEEGKYGLEHLMMDYERRFIEDALNRWKNTRKAAAHLGISQSQLMRKKQKYNIGSEKSE